MQENKYEFTNIVSLVKMAENYYVIPVSVICSGLGLVVSVCWLTRSSYHFSVSGVECGFDAFLSLVYVPEI